MCECVSVHVSVLVRMLVCFNKTNNTTTQSTNNTSTQTLKHKPQTCTAQILVYEILVYEIEPESKMVLSSRGRVVFHFIGHARTVFEPHRNSLCTGELYKCKMEDLDGIRDHRSTQKAFQCEYRTTPEKSPTLDPPDFWG